MEVGIHSSPYVKDRHRESPLVEHLHQHAFDGDFLLRIFPERIAERRVLLNDVMAWRLLIDGRRADEHVLVCPPGKDLDISLRLIDIIDDEIHHGIELMAGQGLLHAGGIRTIPGNPAHRFRQVHATESAIEDVQFDALLHRQPCTGSGDIPAPADKQNFHDTLLRQWITAA